MATEPAPKAMAVLAMAQAGRFAEICDLFVPGLRAMVAPEALRAGWNNEIGRCGPVCSVGTPITESAGAGLVVVKVPVTFEHGELTVIVGMDDEGRLTGLHLASATAAGPIEPWQPPDYADPATFDEQEVTVGSGPFAVPGTLTLPRRPGPGAAVVLLTGSGPNDRDETLGRNKPLKDLAWGLASRGIAVLRFDKVTHAHRGRVVGAEFTLTDEYVPHAVAAVRLLQQHPEVDPAWVFVLGHSLGGSVAPRVAAAEPSVAGLVLLAGGTQPLHWAAVRQIRHLASLGPDPSAAESTIEAMTRQARMVDSPELSTSTPSSQLPFGVPAAYWLDLRSYDPAAVAATLDQPILILHGGRDYQVTTAEDLAGWKAGLAGRPEVTICVYDNDNHLFFPGTGPPTPAEYEPAQHVDPAVVAEIATWLTSRASPSDVQRSQSAPAT